MAPTMASVVSSVLSPTIISVAMLAEEYTAHSLFARLKVFQPCFISFICWLNTSLMVFYCCLIIILLLTYLYSSEVLYSHVADSSRDGAIYLIVERQAHRRWANVHQFGDFQRNSSVYNNSVCHFFFLLVNKTPPLSSRTTCHLRQREQCKKTKTYNSAGKAGIEPTSSDFQSAAITRFATAPGRAAAAALKSVLPFGVDNPGFEPGSAACATNSSIHYPHHLYLLLYIPSWCRSSTSVYRR